MDARVIRTRRAELLDPDALWSVSARGELFRFSIFRTDGLTVEAGMREKERELRVAGGEVYVAEGQGGS